jgi:membrane protein DedA with SNARE-associated domain
MQGLVDAALGFISANRDWAALIAFAFAFAETTAFLSIVIPSTAILVGVGAIVATGALDFTPIWLGAALGAIAGSTFSWWLGLRYGDRILRLWPLRDHPELVGKGTAAFARFGPAAILIGHFFGPLRSVVFLMAGMSRMGTLRFQSVNLAGAVAWAFLIPKSGQIGGDLLGVIWHYLSGS